MTDRMTAKQYLNQIRKAEFSIRAKKAQYASLRASMLGIPGSKVGQIGASCSKSPDEHMVAMLQKLSDLEEEIWKEIAAYRKTADTITNQILDMPDSRYSELLYHRYVESMGFERIARTMHYDGDYIRKMHGRALQAFTGRYLRLAKQDTKRHI